MDHRDRLGIIKGMLTSQKQSDPSLLAVISLWSSSDSFIWVHVSPWILYSDHSPNINSFYLGKSIWGKIPLVQMSTNYRMDRWKNENIICWVVKQSRSHIVVDNCTSPFHSLKSYLFYFDILKKQTRPVNRWFQYLWNRQYKKLNTVEGGYCHVRQKNLFFIKHCVSAVPGVFLWQKNVNFFNYQKCWELLKIVLKCGCSTLQKTQNHCKLKT
jgi:hypothetical protein